jgi:hypothetical protein
VTGRRPGCKARDIGTDNPGRNRWYAGPVVGESMAPMGFAVSNVGTKSISIYGWRIEECAPQMKL